MKIFLIAKNTLIELARQKFFLVVVFVSLIFFALSFLLGAMSIDEQQQILTQLGLTGIQLSAIGVSLFIGAQIMAKEIEKQTCLLILSRPLSRVEFYIGKWVGIVELLFILIFSLGMILFLLLGMSIPLGAFLWSLAGIFIESVILLAVVFWMSVLFQPIMATLVGFFVFIVGNWIPDLQYFAQKSESGAFVVFAKVIRIACPNLFQLNSRSFYLLQNSLISQNLAWIIFHSLAWILFLLLLGIVWFRRKDLVQSA